MKAKDVMTSPVVSVEIDNTVSDAVRIMLTRRISGLPVVDKSGRLVGIVTEGDFLRRAETGTQRRRPRWLEFIVGPGRLASEYARTHGRKIGEIMTADPVTVTEDTPLDEVVRLMERRQIKRVPVMSGKTMVGLISRANLLHAFASAAREVQPIAQSDEVIRARLMAELEKQPWAPIALINPVVRDGIVELWGSITDDRERSALVVASENIPGVKGVRDHLAWIDPATGTVFQPDEDATQAKAS
jgi:CBS domain-containing protein